MVLLGPNFFDIFTSKCLFISTNQEKKKMQAFWLWPYMFVCCVTLKWDQALKKALLEHF